MTGINIGLTREADHVESYSWIGEKEFGKTGTL